jgi:hypothetical protein
MSRQNIKVRVSLLALLLITIGGLCPPDLVARQVERQVMTPEEVIAALRSGHAHGGYILRAFREDLVLPHRTIPGDRARFSDAQRQELLDGLEAIGREDPALDLGTGAIAGAFSTLISIALHPDYDPPPEAAEIPGRVLRIHREAGTRGAKGLATFNLGVLLRTRPPESPEIEQLLLDQASGEDTVLALTSISALMAACEAGIPAIRRLHEEGLVRDWMNSHGVRRVAEAGYTLEAMEQEVMAPPCT